MIKTDEKLRRSSPIKFYLWLFAIASASAGTQFAFSIQFAIGQPLFVSKLKLTNSVANLIMATSGPIAGLITQPIVGAFSDNSTFRWGRRRIFILIGALVTMVGMIAVGCSVEIARLLGEKPDGETPSDHKIGLAFAIGGLWLMNIFLNMMQGPARALVNDLVSPQNLQTANAIVTTVMAFSNIIANISGAQLFRGGSAKEPYLLLFNIGAGVILLTIIPTLICAKETRFEITDKSEKKSVKETFLDIYRGFRYMSKDFFIVLMLYYFSWAGYAPTMVNLTTFYKDNVFGSDEGIEKGMYAIALFAAFTFLFSFILPYIIRGLGTKGAYLLTQIPCIILYGVTPIISNLPFPAIMIITSLVGPNYGTFHSIPFALASAYSSGQSEGLSMGVLNVASVLSQTITNAIGSAIIRSVPKLPSGAQDVSWGIALGSIFSFLASVWCILLLPNRPVLKTDEVVEEINETEPLIQKIEEGGDLLEDE